jgi:hypothetical protein
MGREPREVWEKRVERWRESGLTAREFAAETGVNANTLANWGWRLRRPGDAGVSQRRKRGPSSSPAAAAPVPLKFVELVAKDNDGVGRASSATAGATATIELVVGSGRTLRVPPGFDAESLRRLLAVLETV